MRKLTLIFSVCMAVLFFTHVLGQAPKPCDAKVYFVDRYLKCLIPINYKIPAEKVEKQAESILSTLLKEQEKDQDFLSYSAGFDGEVSLSVKGETAYLDLSEKFAKAVPNDRENQELFIYQLVNSLCSIPKIEYVALTVEGKKPDDYLVFFKDYEFFSPNYGV